MKQLIFKYNVISTTQLKYFHIFMLKLINFPWWPMLTTGFISLFILVMPIFEQLYTKKANQNILYFICIIHINCRQP